METSEMLELLDGAEGVCYSEEFGMVCVWFGGPTFNVYTEQGANVDAFTVYGEGATAPDPHTARAEMQAWKRELNDD